MSMGFKDSGVPNTKKPKTRSVWFSLVQSLFLCALSHYHEYEGMWCKIQKKSAQTVRAGLHKYGRPAIFISRTYRKREGGGKERRVEIPSILTTARAASDRRHLE
jgi:hypothetical protein